MLYNLTTSKAIQPRIRCQLVASAAVGFFDSRLGKMTHILREQWKNTQQLTIPNSNLNFKLFLFHIFCRCKFLASMASMGFDWHPEAVNLDERAGAFAAKVVSPGWCQSVVFFCLNVWGIEICRALLLFCLCWWFCVMFVDFLNVVVCSKSFCFFLCSNIQ